KANANAIEQKIAPRLGRQDSPRNGRLGSRFSKSFLQRTACLFIGHQSCPRLLVTPPRTVRPASSSSTFYTILPPEGFHTDSEGEIEAVRFDIFCTPVLLQFDFTVCLGRRAN